MADEAIDARAARAAAHELNRRVRAGDDAARRRVLTSHPSYAGRPAARLGGERFTLSDAQWTVARECGYETWRDLVSASDLVGTVRSDASFRDNRLTGRAFAQARAARGCDLVDDRLVFLALLYPPEPTPALDALARLGVDPDDAADRLVRGAAGDEPITMSTTPAFQVVEARAAGIALGLGHRDVRDEHVLLAFAYAPRGPGGSLLTALGLDPDEVVDALAAAGVEVPAIRPPVPEPPPGIEGPTVYYPKADADAVGEAQRERFPPGSAFIGFNHSRWMPGYCLLMAPDDIDLESLVRGAVADPSTVVVVDADESARQEDAAAAAARREDAVRGRAEMRRE